MLLLLGDKSPPVISPWPQSHIEWDGGWNASSYIIGGRRWRKHMGSHRVGLLHHLFFFFFFNLSAVLPGMLDLSSPTRDGTQPPCIGKGCLNHQTTREVPAPSFLPKWEPLFLLWARLLVKGWIRLETKTSLPFKWCIPVRDFAYQKVKRIICGCWRRGSLAKRVEWIEWEPEIRAFRVRVGGGGAGWFFSLCLMIKWQYPCPLRVGEETAERQSWTARVFTKKLQSSHRGKSLNYGELPSLMAWYLFCLKSHTRGVLSF